MQRYERSLLLVDVSGEDSYVLDVLRVAGGCDHAKMTHPNFGTATVTGLELAPLPDFPDENVQMRNFRGGKPEAGWRLDWKIEDPCGLLPADRNVHLRYTDLSSDVEAAMVETWLASKHGGANHEGYLPSLMVRRQTAGEVPLISTFVAVMEPYEDQSNIQSIRRLPLQTSDGNEAGDTHVAVEITLTDGRIDLLIAADTDGERTTLAQTDWICTTDADFCVIRRDVS